jgi:hypothetical protein
MCSNERQQQRKIYGSGSGNQKWPNGNPLLQLRPRWPPGIFRANQLCPTVFMSFGRRRESTTGNIPELGISEI